MGNVKCIYHSRELESEIGSHKNPVILLDDDIHVIEKVKGFILPQCYSMKTHHRPN
jgi:hypothetical protein